jgi:ethanolamine utilization cobalamin adenosyltransferase
VCDVARHPRSLSRVARAAGETLPARAAARPEGEARYRVLATGELLDEKPESLTHLGGPDVVSPSGGQAPRSPVAAAQSLVSKTHPRMDLRGKLDLLEGHLLDAQIAANDAGVRDLVGELEEAVELTRKVVGAEVTGRPLGAWTLGGMDAARIRWASHHTQELFGVPFMYPSVRHGAPVAKLYLARGMAREAERALLRALPDRADLLLALNRVSSYLYVLTCKVAGGRYDSGRRPVGPVRGWRPPGKGQSG